MACNNKSDYLLSLESATATTSSIVPGVEGEELIQFLQTIKDEGDEAALMMVVEPFASEMSLSPVAGLPTLYNNLHKQEYECLSYQSLCEIAQTIKEEVTPELCRQILMATLKQSSSMEWFHQRTGRITASNFKRVCKTSISRPSLSLIKNICYPVNMTFRTKATDWGLRNEKNALEDFKEHSFMKHVNFRMEKTGLYVDCDFPYLGASPDAMVSCDCCGQGCVEVKCPYLLKNMDFNSYTKEKNSCLRCVEDNFLLKSDHAYYYQIQIQMKITKTKYCYFVVWSPNGYTILRILFDQGFWNMNFPKALEFHRNVVFPELLGKYFTKGKHLNQSWCYCNKIDDGRPMIICENEDCEVQWFHLNCVGLSSCPEDTWICKNCV